MSSRNVTWSSFRTFGPERSANGRKHAQVATPAHVGVDRGELLAAGDRAGRLAYRLGQRHEVVNAVRRRVELAVVPDEIPAPGRGQPAGVRLTQVVRVGLGERGERA